MSREISFCLSSDVNGDDWTNVTSIKFSQYYVLMYYSSLISETEGLKLMNASLSQQSYNYENGLPTNTADEYKAYSNSIELQIVVDFLNIEVIPSLQNEPQETDLIIDIYGGIDNFVSSYYTGAPYLKYFNVFENEIEAGYTAYVPNILSCAIKLRDFFQMALDQNETYNILVE